MKRVVIPETALTTNQDRRSRQAADNKPGNNASSDSSQKDKSAPQGTSNRAQPQRKSGTIFVVDSSRDQPTVTARQVALGTRQDGQVEILSGLQLGDRYVVRSSKALKDNAPVRLSVLSEGK